MDPRMILAILGTGIFSLVGIGIWLWRFKKSAQQSAIREREYLQMKKDLERNKEANESYPNKLKEELDKISDAVDPADPWAGLR